jgi:outer membrane protein TolC
LSIPVFDGGKISADVQQARATLRQRQSEYEDQKAKVEQDVRNALIQLRTALGQVKLAESNRQYARETLTQVNDRFDAGVTNTVEVVQAQQQEAAAENDYISGLYALAYSCPRYRRCGNRTFVLVPRRINIDFLEDIRTDRTSL